MPRFCPLLSPSMQIVARVYIVAKKVTWDTTKRSGSISLKEFLCEESHLLCWRQSSAFPWRQVLRPPLQQQKPKQALSRARLVNVRRPEPRFLFCHLPTSRDTVTLQRMTAVGGPSRTSPGIGLLVTARVATRCKQNHRFSPSPLSAHLTRSRSARHSLGNIFDHLAPMLGWSKVYVYKNSGMNVEAGVVYVESF